MKQYNSKEFAPAGSQSAAARTAERSFRLWPRVLGGLALVVLLVIGCGGWAAIAKLEGAVVASGIVRVDQNLKEVQHRDGGIVKTLAIRQGDLVKEGQVLATLDDVQIKAELLIVRSQLGEALGRQARLIAERDNLAVDRISGRSRAGVERRGHRDARRKPPVRRQQGWAGTARRSNWSSASTRPWRRSREWKRGAPPRRRRSNWLAPSATSWTICSRRRSSSIRASTRRIATGRGYWESAARSRPASPARRSAPAKSGCRSSPLTRTPAPRRNAICEPWTPGFRN